MPTREVTEVRAVAFIGVGNMGAPMARRVKSAGYELIVCDRDQAVLDAFAEEGAITTRNAADCAAADVVILLLANDAQVQQTVMGEGGLVHAIAQGHHPIICMMGTTLPDTLNTLRDPLEKAGATLVDAPISGGIVGAQRGTLTIMMGGDTADVQAITPLMRAMGEKLFHCGPLGSGEVVKVINNMLCVANMFLTAEAANLGDRYGVSLEKLSEILSVSTGLNFLTADAATARAQYAAWARNDEAYVAIHNVVNKDLHLAQQLARNAGLALGGLDSIAAYVDSNDTEAMQRWMQAGRVS